MEHPFKRLAAALCAAALLAGCTASAPAAGTALAEPSAAPAASAAPAEETDPLLALCRSMTLRQQVGQLFLVRPDALDLSIPEEQLHDAQAEGVQALSAEMTETLAQYPVGGVVLFGKNIAGEAQCKAFTAQLAQARPGGVGMLIAVDEEGGRVARLANHPALTVPQVGSAASVAAGQDPARAEQMGLTLGSYLKEYGFNLDFAPVADLNTGPDDSVIGDRAFGSDPDQAAQMVAAAVSGFHQAGIACTLKHFPGHGDTQEDSHEDSVYIDKTWEELYACELAPFRAGIQAGADLVMAGHISTPNAAADGLPASLSHAMLTDCLRGELGFDGVIVTDSLAMGAITRYHSAGEAALLALQAGADLLLMPQDLRQAFDAVAAAVESGTLSRERLEESVCRVLALKQSLGLLDQA